MADEAQMKVRLLRSLKAKVDAAAHENRRTLNAEIVARLERTFVEDTEREKGGMSWMKMVAQRSKRSSADGVFASDSTINERLEVLEKDIAEIKMKLGF